MSSKQSAARRGPSKAEVRNKTARGGEGGVVAEQDLERERAALIQERQRELDVVIDRHDTLIREVFHLEKWVSLLAFDPQQAKDDKSEAFQKFQAQYDLLSTSSAAGPSRRTRQAQTARLELLKGPSSASSAPLPRASAARKSRNEPSTSTFWEIRDKVKGKGKEKMGGTLSAGLNGSKPHTQGEGAISTELALSTEKPQTGSRKRIHDAITNGTPLAKKRKVYFEVRSPEHAAFPSDSVSYIRRSDTSRTSSPALAESISAVLPRRSRRMHTESLSAPLVPTRTPTSPSIPVRRVKLIVRKPPPSLSHPLQRPRAPSYGESLRTFLSSYTVMDDEDVDSAKLTERAREDAVLLEKIHRLRTEGRLFFPITDVATSADASRPPRGPDVWDHILQAVESRRQVRTANGWQVAAHVAKLVKAYWDSQLIRDSKAQAQEEKRLRMLAKATIKMVTAEWKRVVHHIREQERLRIEEEERKRGQEHLDAILDQSGQILEAQQVELSKGDGVRSRSRSSSIATALHRQTTPSSQHENEDSNSEREDEDDSAPDSDDGDDMDISLREFMGMSDHVPSAATGSSRSSAAQSPYASSPALEPADPEDMIPGLDLDGSSVASSMSIRHDGVDEVMDVDTLADKSSEIGIDPVTPPQEPPLDASVSIISKGKDHAHTGESSGAGVQFSPPQLATAFVERSPSEEYNDVDFISQSAKTPSAITPNGARPIYEADATELQRASSAHAHFEDETDKRDDGVEEIADPDREDVPQTEDNFSDEEEFIPEYLKPYAIAPVEWNPQTKVKAPLLLRGCLRPYQQAGLEWLASIHLNNLNGILADEMGLGKTIQTISLLAHLACDRGIWGPHLIIVPTSVLLNWEMEFKKFLPGFKVLSYHGNTKRRKELRQGWNNKYHFNVCVTSYTLASRDAHVFKRKPWYYMILDEAHMIKNFKSQRWNTLLMFRSFRRLLLTGTPLQNNLTELWALLQFLMSGTNFANLKEFGEWFSNPLEKAIEMGTALDDETQQRVSKLHTVLRPYLLRRLKRDVEKELPSKFEHLVMCPLSKRQRFLYDEFMARAETRHDLHSGVYQKIANILMQLRKVVNHPDLFEVRPISTSFAMNRSAVADFEIKELLVRRRLLKQNDDECINFDVLGLSFIDHQNTPFIAALETHSLDGTASLPLISELPGEPPPYDTRTIEGYRKYRAYQQRAASIARWNHIGYLNRLRCSYMPIVGAELITITRRLYQPLLPLSALDLRFHYLDTVKCIHSMVKSYATRAEEMIDIIDRFAFVTPSAVARDLPSIALSGFVEPILQQDLTFDAVLHRAAVKLQIAFPDPSLLQYDCGKLQELARLLRERKSGGHRVLIFTQMTRILDILEIFLNLHGYLYLRLDGATKIEDRQYITERFNTDSKIFCFISSSRSGGVGINLTGADTVVFYDSDFNPQMDRQCEDRAHRIGQIRDVHIYRFISQHTVEEALLRKANQKRSLDDLVIQKGEFDWRSLFRDETALTKALGEFEDTEDAHAAAVAASEEVAMVGADEADFGAEGAGSEGRPASHTPTTPVEGGGAASIVGQALNEADVANEPQGDDDEEEMEEEGGTTVDYMLVFVHSDLEFFSEWRL